MVKLESELTGVLDIKDLTKVLIIVAFDVPSEGKLGISIEEKNFLMAMRRTFVNNLYDLDCGPIQQSLFRVPTTLSTEMKKKYPALTAAGIVTEVQKRVAEFKQKYSDGWLDKETGKRKSYLADTRMEVLAIAMSDEGYDTFVGMQVDGLYAWISKLLETFEKWIEKGKTTEENIKRWQRDLDSIEDAIEAFFGPGSTDFTQERYDNLKNDLEMLGNTYQEVLDKVTVEKKKK